MLFLFLLLVQCHQAGQTKQGLARRLHVAETSSGKTAINFNTLQEDIWGAKELLEDSTYGSAVDVKEPAKPDILSNEERAAKQYAELRRVLITLRRAKDERPELVPYRRSRFLLDADESSHNSVPKPQSDVADVESVEGKPAPVGTPSEQKSRDSTKVLASESESDSTEPINWDGVDEIFDSSASSESDSSERSVSIQVANPTSEDTSEKKKKKKEGAVGWWRRRRRCNAGHWVNQYNRMRHSYHHMLRNRNHYLHHYKNQNRLRSHFQNRYNHARNQVSSCNRHKASRERWWSNRYNHLNRVRRGENSNWNRKVQHCYRQKSHSERNLQNRYNGMNKSWTNRYNKLKRRAASQLSKCNRDKSNSHNSWSRKYKSRDHWWRSQKRNWDRQYSSMTKQRNSYVSKHRSCEKKHKSKMHYWKKRYAGMVRSKTSQINRCKKLKSQSERSWSNRYNKKMRWWNSRYNRQSSKLSNTVKQRDTYMRQRNDYRNKYNSMTRDRNNYRKKLKDKTKQCSARERYWASRYRREVNDKNTKVRNWQNKYKNRDKWWSSKFKNNVNYWSKRYRNLRDAKISKEKWWTSRYGTLKQAKAKMKKDLTRQLTSEKTRRRRYSDLYNKMSGKKRKWEGKARACVSKMRAREKYHQGRYRNLDKYHKKRYKDLGKYHKKRYDKLHKYHSNRYSKLQRKSKNLDAYHKKRYKTLDKMHKKKYAAREAYHKRINANRNKLLNKYKGLYEKNAAAYQKEKGKRKTLAGQLIAAKTSIAVWTKKKLLADQALKREKAECASRYATRDRYWKNKMRGREKYWKRRVEQASGNAHRVERMYKALQKRKSRLAKRYMVLQKAHNAEKQKCSSEKTALKNVISKTRSALGQCKAARRNAEGHWRKKFSDQVAKCTEKTEKLRRKAAKKLQKFATKVKKCEVESTAKYNARERYWMSEKKKWAGGRERSISEAKAFKRDRDTCRSNLRVTRHRLKSARKAGAGHIRRMREKMEKTEKACQARVSEVRKDKHRREAYWEKKYHNREKWWTGKLKTSRGGLSVTIEDLRKRYSNREKFWQKKYDLSVKSRETREKYWNNKMNLLEKARENYKKRKAKELDTAEKKVHSRASRASTVKAELEAAKNDIQTLTKALEKCESDAQICMSKNKDKEEYFRAKSKALRTQHAAALKKLTENFDKEKQKASDYKTKYRDGQDKLESAKQSLEKCKAKKAEMSKAGKNCQAMSDVRAKKLQKKYANREQYWNQRIDTLSKKCTKKNLLWQKKYEDREKYWSKQHKAREGYWNKKFASNDRSKRLAQKYQSRYKQAKQKLTVVTTQLKAARNDLISHKSSSAKKCKAQRDELELKINSYKHKIKSELKRGVTYRKRIRDLSTAKSKLAGAKAEISKLKGGIKNRNSALKNAEKKISDLRKRLGKSAEKMIDLRSKLRHYRDVHPKKTSAVQKRLIRSQASNQKLKIKVKTLEDEVNNLNGKVIKAKSSYSKKIVKERQAYNKKLADRQKEWGKKLLRYKEKFEKVKVALAKKSCASERKKCGKKVDQQRLKLEKARRQSEKRYEEMLNKMQKKHDRKFAKADEDRAKEIVSKIKSRVVRIKTSMASRVQRFEKKYRKKMREMRKGYKNELSQQEQDYEREQAVWNKQKQVLMKEALAHQDNSSEKDEHVQLLEHLVIYLHNQLVGGNSAAPHGQADNIVDQLLQRYQENLSAESQTSTSASNSQKPQ